jgi:hypothetical protein
MSAAEGSADIFFPTDFKLLERLVRGASGRPQMNVTVKKSADFLEQHAAVERTRTMIGYNPMLQDYPNTRFLLT